jgi:hypothetical protein
MTLLTIPADTRSGKMEIYTNPSIIFNHRTEAAGEIEVIDDRTDEVLLHLFRVHYKGPDVSLSKCFNCDLYEDDYMSLCGIVPCSCSVWKNIKKAMEDL